jgi:2-(1,2-epoxy-1,2-dihydrophenyl)acetyl-CoA isomerase
MLQASTTDGRVLVERAGARATVTLCDPERLNSLSLPLATELHEALRELLVDLDLRAIVLTGADPAFSAGAGPEPSAVRLVLGEVAKLVVDADVPVIAAVNGLAAGAGLALALACDVVLASDRACLAPAPGRVGLLSEVGVSFWLTRRLGYHRTLSLFSRGQQLSAREAAETGLVDAAVGHDELADAVSFWCAVASLSATPDGAKPLLRAATQSGWGRATVMREFAA